MGWHHSHKRSPPLMSLLSAVFRGRHVVRKTQRWVSSVQCEMAFSVALACWGMPAKTSFIGQHVATSVKLSLRYLKVKSQGQMSSKSYCHRAHHNIVELHQFLLKHFSFFRGQSDRETLTETWTVRTKNNSLLRRFARVQGKKTLTNILHYHLHPSMRPGTCSIVR